MKLTCQRRFSVWVGQICGLDMANLKDCDPKPRAKIDLVAGPDASGVASGKTKIDNQKDNQYGGYDYHFVASLADGSDLLCKVCQFPSRNPHLSSCCGHTFCKSCIDNLKKTATINYACPVCRDSEFSVVQNKQIDRAVRSLHIYCTNEKEGCKWQGEVNDIDRHLKSCQFEGVKCENHGCEKIFQRQFVKSHMDFECPYRDVSCQHCYSVGTHCFIEGKHKDECPKFPLPCPNVCDVGTVAREDVDKHRKVCPLEMIECEYYDMGCEAKIARKNIKNHNKENVEEHLCMVKCELATTKKDLVQAKKDAMTTVKKMVDLQNKFQKQIDDIEIQGQENIKQLEIQLYNAICQLHKNYNPWGLKLDTLAATSECGEQVAPVVIKMTDFAKMKKEKEWWSSNPFYTHNKECKIRLLIFAAGDTNGETTYLSVRLSLLEGSYEQRLPLKGKIELLNQVDNQEHHCVTVDCIDTKENWIIFEEPLFIAHSNLKPISSTCIFLKNDSLFFQVHMKMDESCTILPNKEDATIQQQEPSPQKENLNTVDNDDTKPPMQQEKPDAHEVTKDVQSLSLTKVVSDVPTAEDDTSKQGDTPDGDGLENSQRLQAMGSCNKCHVSFARVMTRKHVCCECGRYYCGTCTVKVNKPTIVSISSWFSESRRVCVTCHEKMCKQDTLL